MYVRISDVTTKSEDFPQINKSLISIITAMLSGRQRDRL